MLKTLTIAELINFKTYLRETTLDRRLNPMKVYYIIPSDNWEQQLSIKNEPGEVNYIIPSDNWEQQPSSMISLLDAIISYQAITGNNNRTRPVT